MEMINLKYIDLIENYVEILRYAVKNSDYMSLISIFTKPYSQTPPSYIHQELLNDLGTYLIRQVKGIRCWSNNGTNNNHILMNIYSCANRNIVNELIRLPNLLLVDNFELPEDMSFYRGNEIWFATVTHEKLGFLYKPNKNDEKFLLDVNIRFSKSNQQGKLFCLND